MLIGWIDFIFLKKSGNPDQTLDLGQVIGSPNKMKNKRKKLKNDNKIK